MRVQGFLIYRIWYGNCILRGLRKTGEITEYEFEERFSALKEESVEVSEELWHQ